MVSALQKYMAEREAGLKRTEELRSMSHSQVVQHLLDAEPELKKKGYSVNLSKFLRQEGTSSDPNVQVLKAGAQNLSDVQISKPIDVSQIIDSSWMRPTKQTALRAALAAQTETIQQRQTKFANVWTDLGSTEKPATLPQAAQSPVKQNDVLPPSVPSEQILETKPDNTGRIDIKSEVPEPDWIKEMNEKALASTPAKTDNSKYFIFGGIAIAALVLFLILRRRK